MALIPAERRQLPGWRCCGQGHTASPQPSRCLSSRCLASDVRPGGDGLLNPTRVGVREVGGKSPRPISRPPTSRSTTQQFSRVRCSHGQPQPRLDSHRVDHERSIALRPGEASCHTPRIRSTSVASRDNGASVLVPNVLGAVISPIWRQTSGLPSTRRQPA